MAVSFRTKLTLPTGPEFIARFGSFAEEQQPIL